MAKIVAYKLKPRSAFHFGERGVGVEETNEFWHSDSLFSAIAAAWRVLDGHQEPNGLLRLLKPFLEGNDLPFWLTSLFPYAGDVLLLPRPMVPVHGVDEESARTRKRLKKIQWVSWAVFDKLARGEKVADWWSDTCLMQDGRVWVTPEERSQLVRALGTDAKLLWRSQDAPRVTVTRITSQSEVYQCGRVHFRSGCGLYFLVEGFAEGYQGLLERALGYLADAGIGGERSAGHGQFVWSRIEGLTLPQAMQPNGFATLSLYWPTPDEVQHDKVLDGAAYSLLNRRGWISSPDGRAQQRRSVWMLGEGSVIAQWGKARYGGLVPVAPVDERGQRAFPHPVYRNGVAFPVGVEVPGDG